MSENTWECPGLPYVRNTKEKPCSRAVAMLIIPVLKPLAIRDFIFPEKEEEPE